MWCSPLVETMGVTDCLVIGFACWSNLDVLFYRRDALAWLWFSTILASLLGLSSYEVWKGFSPEWTLRQACTRRGVGWSEMDWWFRFSMLDWASSSSCACKISSRKRVVEKSKSDPNPAHMRRVTLRGFDGLNLSSIWCKYHFRGYDHFAIHHVSKATNLSISNFSLKGFFLPL